MKIYVEVVADQLKATVPATMVSNDPVAITLDIGATGKFEGTVARREKFVEITGKLIACWERTESYDWPAIFANLVNYGVQLLPAHQKIAFNANSLADQVWRELPQLMDLRGSHACPADSTWGELVSTIFAYTDPDYSGSDSFWIAKVLIAGSSFWEDLPVLTGRLTTFHQRNTELPLSHQDLHRFGSFAQLVLALENAFSPAITNANGYTAEDLAKYSAAPYATTIFNDEGLLVVKLLSIEGSRWWSWLWRKRPTSDDQNLLPSWCTGWDDPYNWEYYTNQGPLYVVLDKTGVLFGKPDKWEIHLESDQFKDRNDIEVDRRKFIQQPFMEAMEQSGLLRDDSDFFPDADDYMAVQKVAKLRNSSLAELVAYMRHFNEAKILRPTGHRATFWQNTYVTKFWVLAIKRSLPTDLVIWLWLLATGNRYAPVLAPPLEIGSVLQSLRANVVLHNEASIMADFAAAATHVGLGSLLTNNLPQAYMLRHARRPTGGYRSFDDWETDRKHFALLIASLTNKFTADYVNKLWTHADLWNIVWAMTKQEFDSFYNLLNQIKPAQLVFKPTRVLPTMYSTREDLPPGNNEHKAHYVLFCLEHQRTPNAATFVSKVRSLNDADYDWLLAAHLRNYAYSLRKGLDMLGLMLAQRTTPHVRTILTVLLNSPNSNASPIVPLIKLFDLYFYNFAALVPLLNNAVTVAGSTGTSADLYEGGEPYNFCQELALAMDCAKQRLAVDSDAGQHAVRMAAMFEQILSTLQKIVQHEPMTLELTQLYAEAKLNASATQYKPQTGFVIAKQDQAVEQLPLNAKQITICNLLASYFADVGWPKTKHGVVVDPYSLAKYACGKPIEVDNISPSEKLMLLQKTVRCYGKNSVVWPVELWGETVEFSASVVRSFAQLHLCCLLNKSVREYFRVCGETTSETQFNGVWPAVLSYLHQHVAAERIFAHAAYPVMLMAFNSSNKDIRDLRNFVTTGVVVPGHNLPIDTTVVLKVCGLALAYYRTWPSLSFDAVLEIFAFLYHKTLPANRAKFATTVFSNLQNDLSRRMPTNDRGVFAQILHSKSLELSGNMPQLEKHA